MCTLLYSDPSIPGGATTWELVADIRAACIQGVKYNLDTGSLSVVQMVGVATAVAMGMAYWSEYLVS